MSTTGLGRMIAGGAGPDARRALDFYPTPPEATQALLHAEREHLPLGLVWEPCGRGGAILRELRAAGYQTTGTDLVADPAEGVRQMDLLDCFERLAPAVITNPPFNLAASMIAHLLTLDVGYIAFLLKATFFHAEKRRALFERNPPARIHALTWRPDFTGGGGPTMDCSWFVWQRGAEGTQYRPLGKAEGVAAATARMLG